ncbi:MAG: aldo/keto reductase [Holophaga sp.]|nr:aldo/keto reductase [Holophaga sp.]
MSLITYNNVPVPSFMYGTAWKKNATAQLAQRAVAEGFRAIDTANQLIHYQEALVGEALLALAQQGVGRDQLFLQTKFTSTNGQDHRTPYDPSAPLPTQVMQSFESSLAHLHTHYLDSYVLHGPYQRLGLGDSDWAVWGTLEGLYQAGRTRMIGISNVTVEQLRQLCAKAIVKPMVVQNRCYASRGWDKEVRSLCQAEGIIYQGFSLLTANPEVLADPAVRSIARRFETGIAQVVFRFAMQIGMLPMTGTTDPQHMKEDLQAEQLSLTPEDVKLIETVGLQT